MLDTITWFDHASFLIEAERTIYIDPWEIPGGPVADIILVSHDHFDHLVVEDIAKVAGPETVIVTTPDCKAKLSDYPVVTLAPGETVEVKGVPIEGVASYNAAKDFHPKGNGWLGFVITLDGQRLYYVGDSDVTPEMKAVKADVVLVPVGGTYTQDAQEAAAAIDAMAPKTAIPYHWGKIVGTEEDARAFAAAVTKAEVVILPKAAPKPKQ